MSIDNRQFGLNVTHWLSGLLLPSEARPTLTEMMNRCENAPFDRTGPF
jgi:hypothetical protein